MMAQRWKNLLVPKLREGPSQEGEDLDPPKILPKFRKTQLTPLNPLLQLLPPRKPRAENGRAEEKAETSGANAEHGPTKLVRRVASVESSSEAEDAEAEVAVVTPSLRPPLKRLHPLLLLLLFEAITWYKR
jgi:hypothetical protein